MSQSGPLAGSGSPPTPTPYISMTPYIVGQMGDTHAEYFSIQSAIDAAAAGASRLDPRTVLVKFGTYTEDLTLADGVWVIGMASPSGIGDFNNGMGCPVIIAGKHTVPTGIAFGFYNVSFSSASANVFEASGDSSNVYLNSCYINDNTALLIGSSGDTPAFYLNECSFTLDQFFVASDGLTIVIDSCQIYASGTASTSNGQLILTGTNSWLEYNYEVDGGGQSISVSTSTYEGSMTMTGTTGASIIMDYVDSGLAATRVFTFTPDCSSLFRHCTLEDVSFPSDQPDFISSQFNGTLITQGTGVTTQQFLGGDPNGTGAGSQIVNQWAEVQTTDDTPTNIFSLTIAQSRVCMITASITGGLSDFTDACCARVKFAVRRQSGGNVTLLGSAMIDIFPAGSTATVTAVVDTGTQTARIQVTGIAAQTWNWRASIQYQFLQ